jgi:hypothetical protein
VAEAIGGQGVRAGLPTQADAAAELAVPQPPPIARQARDLGAIGKRDLRAHGFAVHEALQEAVGIRSYQQEFFLRGFRPQVVGRPSALERGDVARQMRV